MADKINQEKTELKDIPTLCQYQNLSSKDNPDVKNETTDWLKEGGELPFWSRLKSTNCAGQTRGDVTGKEGNYDIELPGRLLSLFGSNSRQTDCVNNMNGMKGHQLLSSIFALCTFLHQDFKEWSINLLDLITSAAITQYPELLQQLDITDNELKISHFKRSFDFNGLEFKTQIHQAAIGFLYIPYSLHEFNLARVLPWFFRQYQFGLMQCNNRTLAFGKTLDSKYAFFMYDCQSRGHPLFADQQASSYILRTTHLQILLYCIIVTFNETKERTHFVIYNADIVMTNPLERKTLKKEIYVPIIGQAKNKLVKKAFDTTVSNKPPTNINNTCNKTTDKSSTSVTSKGTEAYKKLILDPDKMYYIIAVPNKSDTISAKLESKHFLLPKINSPNFENPATENPEDVEANIHRIKEQEGDEQLQAGLTETISFNSKNASKEISTPHTKQTNVLKSSNILDLKVYLVEKSGSNCTTNKIKIAHQLKDFFEKRICLAEKNI